MKLITNYEDLHKLMKKVTAQSVDTSDVIDKTLAEQSTATALADDITDFLPLSNKKKRNGKKHKHAKNSKWWKRVYKNGELDIISKGGAASKPKSFGYLIFPDEGRGIKQKRAQNFGERALQRGTVLRIIGNNLQDAVSDMLDD